MFARGFIDVGKVVLELYGVCLRADVFFWVTFCGVNVYKWDDCWWEDISCVFILGGMEAGFYDILIFLVLIFCVVLC